jgi:hypothetical protein
VVEMFQPLWVFINGGVGIAQTDFAAVNANIYDGRFSWYFKPVRLLHDLPQLQLS